MFAPVPALSGDVFALAGDDGVGDGDNGGNGGNLCFSMAETGYTTYGHP